MKEAVQKVVASQQPVMTNMQIQNVEFWAPLNTVELLQAIVQTKAQMLAMELVYTSQIKERLQEVHAMMEEIKTHAAVLSQVLAPESVPGVFRALFVQGMPSQISVWSRVYEENQQAS
jgi:polyribonucleotide nucleotidyltransferase